MSGIVVTACTNRKRLGLEPNLTAESLPGGTMADVAAKWLAQITLPKNRVPAHCLYCGRSFAEATRAAKASGMRLIVVSAGLGLIGADAEIPAYSLTITSGSPDNVLARVDEGAESRDWWRQISRRSPFGMRLDSLAQRFPDGPMLIALPAPYLRMIESDVLSLPAEAIQRLRIFVRSGPSLLDERLRRYVMPYDGRLDGPASPIRGTHADFAQRAARHFAETALCDGDAGTPDQHRAVVEQALAPLAAPSPLLRARATDEEIARLIRVNWDEAQGRSTRMLRLLRDDLEVACEQKRFQELFRKIRADREAAP